MNKVFVVIGTRPDAIKMAPLYLALRGAPGLDVRLVATGQHRELLAQALEAFGLAPDVNLDVMRPGQELAGLTSRILEAFDGWLVRERPGAVLVHGDTTTALASALAAFYRGVPVMHVEAGLRSRDLGSPFPEELNRQVIAKLAALHFAVDDRARDHLVAEGVDPARVRVVGQTGADALRLVADGAVPGRFRFHRRLAVITLHRREAPGREDFLDELARAVEALPEVHFVLPLHPNPRVRGIVLRRLGDVANLELGEPLSYREFVPLLSRADVVLTDSGGVQEEAFLLGKPVVLLRDRVEREDGLGAGSAHLLPRGPGELARLLRRLLDGPAWGMSRSDGRTGASAAIAREVREFFMGFPQVRFHAEDGAVLRCPSG